MCAQPRSPKVPVSSEHLVAVAIELSREHGLGGWTVRDLEQRAQVSPSSIYHRVGSRDQLMAQVVDSILQSIDVRSETGSWQEYFRASADRLFFGLCPYRGTASWLMVNAPVLGGNLTLMRTGVARLADAGIHPAGLAYSQIVNTALGVIASSEQGAPRRYASTEVHAGLAQTFPEGARTPEASDVRAYVTAFDHDDPEDLQAARLDYFRAAVDVAIAGVDAGYRSGTVRGIERFS